jgi:hypothetical protein
MSIPRRIRFLNCKETIMTDKAQKEFLEFKEKTEKNGCKFNVNKWNKIF